MGITKDGGSETAKTVPLNKKGQPISEYEMYTKENKFKALFYAAANTQSDPHRTENLKDFYKLINQTNLGRIFKENYMPVFLDELHELFLKSDKFNDDEKRSFLNGCERHCIEYALNIKRFDVATALLSLCRNKDLENFEDYLFEKMEENNYEVISYLLKNCTGITYNCSQVLRDMQEAEILDYDYVKSLINECRLDINGLGNTNASYHEWTFAQMVTKAEGTRATEFFMRFVKDFGKQIDLDIKNKPSGSGSHYSILENILFSKDLEPTEMLSRLQAVVENCSLSVKHIGVLMNVLMSERYILVAHHYDHPVYDSIFSHECFNSKLFDREAMLNKLLSIDNHNLIEQVRKNNHYTVNPTSVLLDKFFKYSSPPVRLGKHPFVTWVEKQGADFSNDTLNSLVTYYRDELPTIELHKLTVRPALKKALQANGVPYPEKLNFMSFLLPFRKEATPVNTAMEKMVIDTPIRVITQNVFNTVLVEQIKDEQIKKLIDNIKLNYEQYQAIAHGGMMNENEHYMSNLLPKFLNTTIENYLHFATLDEKEATENALVQLTILNKKTFMVLKEGLEKEQNDLSLKNKVHSKVVQKY